MYMMVRVKKKKRKENGLQYFLVSDYFLLLKYTHILNQNFTCMAHIISHSFTYNEYGTTLNMIFRVTNSNCRAQD